MTLQAHVMSLSIAYALLAALLLLCLSASRLPRIAKVSAIVAMSGFYFMVFFSTQGLLGWSAPVRVPARFQLLWARVIEPNTSQRNPGAVHLWLEETDESNLPSGTPRAFVLPYSRALAERVTAARSEISQGRPQGGIATSFGAGLGAPAAAEAIAPEPGVAPGGDPSGGGLLDPEFLGGQSKTVDLVPLPAPILPPKRDP